MLFFVITTIFHAVNIYRGLSAGLLAAILETSFQVFSFHGSPVFSPISLFFDLGETF